MNITLTSDEIIVLLLLVFLIGSGIFGNFLIQCLYWMINFLAQLSIVIIMLVILFIFISPALIVFAALL